MIIIILICVPVDDREKKGELIRVCIWTFFISAERLGHSKHDKCLPYFGNLTNKSQTQYLREIRGIFLETKKCGRVQKSHRTRRRLWNVNTLRSIKVTYISLDGFQINLIILSFGRYANFQFSWNFNNGTFICVLNQKFKRWYTRCEANETRN